ncbi:transcriptional regulator [Hydrogenophaga sp.]|uniref:helix-turn-helix domain-containing protein n=1 Tax=Hydrogenophaga sp. TaxID=1904254 RepID=UPI00271CC7CC|nr:transcriptional regulator [Hydrogenophaga sp.]MDO9435518.1 transcriptional regulator [Hydrogenophaga sp.]
MDKRLKKRDHALDIEFRDAFYKGLNSGEFSLGEAVRRMQKISKLTQPEFAAHRGISVQALRQIQGDTGNPTVETLNKIASIFGLEVGFVPRRRRNESASR